MSSLDFVNQGLLSYIIYFSSLFQNVRLYLYSDLYATYMQKKGIGEVLLGGEG